MTSTFDEFWNLYPRKVERKGAEKKYWAVRKDVTHETLMAGLQRYVDHIEAKGTEKQFIKHPKTWLNNGCWDDDLDTTRATTEHTIRPMPQYLRKDNTPPRPSAEDRAKVRFKAEVHEVMRKRGVEPALLPEDEYRAAFAEIAAKIEGAL